MQTPLGRIPWFRSLYGDEHLALYPHRDRVEGRHAVRLLSDVTGKGAGACVLELSCGAAGRLVELEEARFRATGIDLSWPSLRRAALTVDTSPLLRGDFRALPFGDRSFDVVTNFFPSFGWFPGEHDDLRVLGEVRRVLRDDGWFSLDFPNPERVRSGLVAEEVRQVDDLALTHRRRMIDGGRGVEKRVTVEGAGEGRPLRFVERLRLYERHELEPLLRHAGLEPSEWFGDYHRSGLGPESPRIIVMGRVG